MHAVALDQGVADTGPQPPQCSKLRKHLLVRLNDLLLT